MTEQSLEERWSSAWPDALAFVLGLGVAWMAGWTTTDLVWSLWLSSLVVGYSTIVWTIVRPGVDIVRGASRDRALIHQAVTAYRGATVAGIGILLFIGLFTLTFFTIHFGGFHYVHSQFLYMFFPLDGGDAGRVATAGMSTYVEVVRRYWLFLPSAFLAERAGFLRQPQPTTDDLAVTPMAIAARKAANARRSGAMMAPYRNVMRMHGLIFFFALAHFAHVDSFIVYAVVYAVYFFPWRLVGKKGAQGAQSARGAQGSSAEA
jgi:uncharacterized protein DUF6498